MSLLLIDEEFLPRAKSLIVTAKKSIWISSFKLEITKKRRGERLAQLFDFLAAQVRGNADVRVLTNKPDNRGHIPDTNAYAIRELKRLGIPVRYLRDNRLCHAKILLVDGRIAIVGSHNLSVRSCHNNFEASCFLDSWVAIRALIDVYEVMWGNAQKA